MKIATAKKSTRYIMLPMEMRSCLETLVSASKSISEPIYLPSMSVIGVCEKHPYRMGSRLKVGVV